MGARERQQDKAQGTQRMQLLAVVINKEVGAPQPMAEEDELLMLWERTSDWTA